MIAGRRKIALQLTPLLDLMLIVIFAQYLTMREQTHEREARATEALQDVERQRQELTAARREAVQIADTALDQRDLIGQMAAELFDLPDDTIERLLKQRFRDDPPDADEIATMQQEFRKLKGRRGQEIVKHLLTFNEIRKRCDVWELHVAETGVTTLRASSEGVDFRAESSEAFAARVFGHYRLLPQPKSLVIVTLSYGDIRATAYEAAINGLPLAIERMQADSAGRTRFEYAMLGYDPQRQGIAK